MFVDFELFWLHGQREIRIIVQSRGHQAGQTVLEQITSRYEPLVNFLNLFLHIRSLVVVSIRQCLDLREHHFHRLLDVC